MTFPWIMHAYSAQRLVVIYIQDIWDREAIIQIPQSLCNVCSKTGQVNGAKDPGYYFCLLKVWLGVKDVALK